MQEPLPLDVLDRLNRDFGDHAAAVAALLLASRENGSEEFLCDRLARCIVHAAGADEQRIQQLIDMERRDYRDVILAGEYDAAGSQVRDLHSSFLIDSEEKFWASTITRFMGSRGYRLTVLETRSATVGPFRYPTDYSEGQATFVGPLGELTIEKRDRQWSLSGNRSDIAAHGMDRVFNDEGAFCDRVTGYLLSNVRMGFEP